MTHEEGLKFAALLFYSQSIVFRRFARFLCLQRPLRDPSAKKIRSLGTALTDLRPVTAADLEREAAEAEAAAKAAEEAAAAGEDQAEQQGGEGEDGPAGEGDGGDGDDGEEGTSMRGGIVCCFLLECQECT